MTVDFEFKKSPRRRLMTRTWTGPWSDKRIRTEFERVAKWAKDHRIQTGKWVFTEPRERQWRVGVEVKGKVKSAGTMRLKTLPSGSVASITFDPDVVSPRVVYHGLTDWLRWRKKDQSIRSAGAYREIYGGNPWSDPKAWSKTTVEVVVRK